MTKPPLVKRLFCIENSLKMSKEKSLPLPKAKLRKRKLRLLFFLNITKVVFHFTHYELPAVTLRMEKYLRKKVG